MILTLAVAVGANLAMFGLIDRALLSPPAHVVDAARVFTLGFEHIAPDGQRFRMSTTSYVAFDAILDAVPAASAAAAWARQSAGGVVDGEQIQTEAMLVSGGYFPMLGARPAMGRTILPDDDRAPAGSPVAVLSHAFWRRAFAGDAGALGRHITVKGQDFVVVGVMPDGFSGHSATRVDLWVPLHAAMDQAPGWDRNLYHNLVEVGLRVRADQTAGAAAAQAGVAAGVPVVLTPISGARVSPAEHTIAYWLAAVSALVLVIGLANAATLLLVRGARRARELGIRAALGASSGRLLSQLVVESAVLAAIAMAASLLLASWIDDAVRRLLLPSLVETRGVNWRTAGVAAIAGLCTVAVGAAVGAVRLRALRRDGHFAAASRHRRPSAALLLVQTTLAVVLLAGAGMFGRSLYTLAGQDFGMRMDGVLLVHFEQGPGFAAGQDQLFTSALERIRALPGVARVSPVGTLPFTGFNVPPFSVPGRATAPTIDGQLPFLIAATPELFDILGLDVREGRRFTQADESNPAVALVNETMARTIWPGVSALGQCFRIGFDPAFDPETAAGPPVPSPALPCRRVVGVVRDVRQRSVLPTGSEARLMQYDVPFSQVPGPPPFVTDPGPRIQGLMVRVTGGADTLEGPIRRLVIGSRTNLPFLYVRPYAQLLEPQIRPWRMGTRLLALFSGLALIVAAVGLYAAFAHSVGQRRRELAVRIAIGARPRRVMLMILRESGGLALAGVACGSVAAAIAGRWTRSLLYGTIAIDPLVLGAAAAVMLVVAIAATLVPAIAASRADPCDLLRVE